MQGYWASLALVVLAEMGDKTQLLAMAFATRFHWYLVLLGISVATATNHLSAGTVIRSKHFILSKLEHYSESL